MIHMEKHKAFQEKTVKAVTTVTKVTNIPKSWCLSFIHDILPPLDITIETKKEPS